MKNEKYQLENYKLCADCSVKRNMTKDLEDLKKSKKKKRGKLPMLYWKLVLLHEK